MKAEDEQCPNCQRYIQNSKYQIHLIMCSTRQLRRSRIFSNSKTKTCIFCMADFEKEMVESHMMECDNRLISCYDCQDMYPLPLFHLHQEVCPAREHENECLGQRNSFLNQIPKAISGIGSLGLKLFEKGKNTAESLKNFLKVTFTERIQNMRQNFHQVQQELLEMIERAILPLADDDQIQGMPPWEIQKLSTFQYKIGMKEGETCSVCCCNFEEREQVKKLRCNHIYHPDCINKWLQINRTCPICRKDQMRL